MQVGWWLIRREPMRSEKVGFRFEAPVLGVDLWWSSIGEFEFAVDEEMVLLPYGHVIYDVYRRAFIVVEMEPSQEIDRPRALLGAVDELTTVITAYLVEDPAMKMV